MQLQSVIPNFWKPLMDWRKILASVEPEIPLDESCAFVSCFKVFSRCFGKTLLFYRVGPPKPCIYWSKYCLVLKQEKRNHTGISQKAVLFNWLLYKYSHLQVLIMLVYLIVLNAIEMKLYSLPKDLAALLPDWRQQSATNAAAKQHQSVWSMLVWPPKQPDCCQIILGIMQQKRES